MLQIKMLKNSKFKTYKLILVLVPNFDACFWWLLAGCKQVAQGCARLYFSKFNQLLAQPCTTSWLRQVAQALDVSARLRKVVMFQI